MKISIGTDIVSISRFSAWHLYSRNTLLRIFSLEEIEYCLKIPSVLPKASVFVETTPDKTPDASAAKFAVRFAARESLFKAISQHDSEYKISFLTLCSSVIISKKPSGIPEIKIKEETALFLYFQKNCIKCTLSLSHEKNYAIATVLLYSND